MNYSDYKLEQLMAYQVYRDICDKFFTLAKDDETKQKLTAILYQGGYQNYNPSGGIGKNNPRIDIERRIGLAYLIIRNPDTFEQIANNNIVYFHGTNANALPGIIKYGINSLDESKKNNVEVTTGEQWSRQNGRNFISFTDVLELAEGYSTLRSQKETELSFPVVFGTTKENILNSNFTYVHSDFPEVGVVGCFPKELITCVMVPSNKIDIIRKMVGTEMLVLPIDDVQNKFYSMAPDGYFSINEEMYNTMLKDGFSNNEELKGIKESVFSRKMKSIKNKIEQMKTLFKGDKINERRNIK